MGFSSKNTGEGGRALRPGIVPTQEPKPCLLHLTLAGGLLTTSATWEAQGPVSPLETSWRQRCNSSADSGTHSPITVHTPSLGLLVDPQNH